MPSPVGAPMNLEEVSVTLTSLLIYQEKVLAAEGIFRYLLTVILQAPATLKYERVTVCMTHPASFDNKKEELMSEFKGIQREVLEDGTIKYVLVRDKAGDEQAMAAKDHG
ncbi:hypothetical protein AwEntero_23990 [Enterobacterales bacterium]|nr:hypothetical protein AwEntero_23990 [Enterobacterales bacterium]